MVLERLLWSVNCPSYASFRPLTVARSSSCGHKEVDLAPHAIVGLVIQVAEVEKFPQALGFESLDPFFFLRISEQGPCFTAIEEDRVDKRLVQLELACEADGVERPASV